MKLSDFDFELPIDLIAQSPTTKRSDSRLLYLDKTTGIITHHYFKNLPDLLTAKDLLIFNNTKVIPARLFATKITGGKVEILIERILPNNILLVQTKTSKSLKINTKLMLTNDTWFEIINRQNVFFELTLHSPLPLNAILEQYGQTPLPPYIKHQPNNVDKQRYQTIFAKHEGAVAAPTAGLHFDTELMNQLAHKNIQATYLTLHVGAGTFKPVQTENIKDHKMHMEYMDISPELCEKIKTTKQNKGKIIAVGTTSVRSLETACQSEEIKPYRGNTDIFIYPGYKFKGVDALITNFHLPKSSLLMLVCAFAGYDNIMRAYQEAIKKKYRFFSYGDAMLIK